MTNEPEGLEPPEPEEALDVQFTEPEEKPKRRRGLFAAIFVAILSVPVVFYMAAMPPAPAEAAPAAEVVEEEPPRPPPSRGSSAPAPPPRRSSGGYYQASGDISDIFCRPREGETANEWMGRVPANCQSRYSPPGR